MTSTDKSAKCIYLNSYLTREQNDALKEDHSNIVVLTPDDILTLRLLRDDWQRERVYIPDRMFHEMDKTLDTLNRILKQVE